MAIDDDKLRNISDRFQEEGLQITGFCGSRIGPVMNGIGLVQNGLISSVHFSCHSDSVGKAYLTNLDMSLNQHFGVHWMPALQ
eukprot:6191416-Ditylum_brightwellii.AAC.1